MALVAASLPRLHKPGVPELVDTVRARIIRGELDPGQRLTEERLASELGVSRIPVREALRVLESEGFVASQRHRGTFVASLSVAEAQDLLDVRAALEPLAAAQAARRCTPESLEIFWRLIEQSDMARLKRRYQKVRELNALFHEHLAVASENRTLMALMPVLRYKIEWATSIEAIKRGQGHPGIHHDIVEAIAEGDSGRAATATAAHINASYTSRGWRRSMEVRYET